MKYRCYLLFGPPGSGKGTQGRVLGNIPGFCHVACGEVFRSLDLRTEVALAFIEYSRKGELVPDKIVVELWHQHIEKMIALSRLKPDIDHLLLDGIPRNVKQAQLLEKHLEVRKVFHLHSPNRSDLIARLRRRAIKDNRLDDASDEIIGRRLETYDKESKPVLEFYQNKGVVNVDATRYPYEVCRDILAHIDTHHEADDF
ncbi:MAG: adenylate kinase family protein [Verrucomicrobiota bacterium]